MKPIQSESFFKAANYFLIAFLVIATIVALIINIRDIASL